VLDQAGAAGMTHKTIVALIDVQAMGGWWRQMVTVVCEQERGLREKRQTATG
jgi:hypothetical protein